jgi:hypothetical protein
MVTVVREAASRLYRDAFRDLAPADVERLNATLARVQQNLRSLP